MDYILKLCLPQQYNNFPIIDKNILINTLLFLNIAYTSSRNYKLWFSRNYFNVMEPRERTTSLNYDIDFDICSTERKNYSMESIYETYAEENFYYCPFPTYLFNYFIKNIDNFDNEIHNIYFDFHGKTKCKYMKKDDNIYITFIFSKDLFKKNIKKMLEDFWNIIQNNNDLFHTLFQLNKYHSIYICGHHYNSTFTDYLAYKLQTIYNSKIFCISVKNQYPEQYLCNIENMIYINNKKLNINNSIVIQDECDMCCTKGNFSYRKDLKTLTYDILDKYNLEII